MKAYLITTGAVFALLTLAHLVRMVIEGGHVAMDPVFAIFTIISASLCVWALMLLRKSTRS
jgi:hypothetical protein